MVLLYIYTESVKKKKIMESREKKSVARTWLDLNSTPLGC